MHVHSRSPLLFNRMARTSRRSRDVLAGSACSSDATHFPTGTSLFSVTAHPRGPSAWRLWDGLVCSTPTPWLFIAAVAWLCCWHGGRGLSATRCEPCVHAAAVVPDIPPHTHSSPTLRRWRQQQCAAGVWQPQPIVVGIVVNCQWRLWLPTRSRRLHTRRPSTPPWRP